MNVRVSCFVVHFKCGIVDSLIYTVDEWVSSVILTSHMHDTNTVRENEESLDEGSN